MEIFVKGYKLIKILYMKWKIFIIVLEEDGIKHIFFKTLIFVAIYSIVYSLNT
jgi:hypothetical protein